ncbi:probable salivary secreted peptide [Copidosoma floridanum]|uniref:probable salivary secreted peptide n=1 Tax=Copidosoma floridanum TaxID=29053 RepID=UPI0006C93F6A|nr:probable salivary secreted peptide [Copidosoma floridanum]
MASLRIPVILLLTFVAAILTTAHSNDLIVGRRSPGDFLMQRDPARKSASILQIVKLKKTFTGDNYHKITQIRFLDQNKVGNGAKVTILSGGPNYTFVTAEFKSQRNYGIDFVVELYGRQSFVN